MSQGQEGQRQDWLSAGSQRCFMLEQEEEAPSQEQAGGETEAL